MADKDESPSPIRLEPTPSQPWRQSPSGPTGGKRLPPKRKKRKGVLLLALSLLAIGAGIFWWLRSRTNDPIAQETRILNELAAIKRYHKAKPLMGTEARITFYCSDPQLAERAFEAAFARGEEINKIASDYDPNSELSQINQAPARQAIQLSPDLFILLAFGLETAKHTNGAYDPALGTLTQLWRQARESGTLSSPEEQTKAFVSAGYKKMALDKRLKTLTKLDSNLRFDLGGLAKGYAADQILATLKAFGITQAMIELGGDIRCGDAPHDKAGWNIGLRSPLPTITDSIVVSNCAISTSGDRFQAIEINGQRYSHILDPATGLGQTQPILATVVAPTALQSDPMSTAACIDPKYFAALSSATDIHSYIWIRNGLQVSPGFPERSTLSTPLEPAKSQ